MSQLIARTAAHAAYQAAIASPATTDWREIAETLFSALPALPKAARESGFPTWWAEYQLPAGYLTDSLDVLFADGETVRVNIHRAPRGLPRVPAACRVAIGFYRERHGHDYAVPAFASLTVTDTGATFDAAACSTFTAVLRAIPGTVTRKAVTLDSLLWMRAELARREAGLASYMRAWNAAPARDRRHGPSTMQEAWRSAVEGGTRELMDMEDAYALQRGERPPYLVRAGIPLDAEQAIGHLADWHDAEPVAFELAGTVDADTGPDFVRDNVGGIVRGEGDYVDTIKSHHIGDALNCIPDDVITTPVMLEQPEATLISAPTIVEADLNVEPAAADDWCPDERSHPIVALALSHRAREELFARVMDGTFPDGVRTAKCGAWRLTLQDALDLQDVASVRWVGLPRKTYTRKAVAAEALATVVAPIPVPAADATACFDTYPAAFYPGALRPDCVLTLHGPSM